MNLLFTSSRSRNILFVALCAIPVFCVLRDRARHTSEGISGFHIVSIPIVNIPVSFARDDAALTSAPAPDAAIPLTVNVDGTQSLPIDSKALQTALADTPLGEGAPDAIPTQNGSAGPDWLLWGGLGGARLPVSLIYPAALPANPPCAYAGGGAVSKTVCLVNRSQHPMQMQVRTRLPRGTYTIERLTLTPNVDSHGTTDKVSLNADHGGESVSGNLQPAADVKSSPVDPNVAFRLERLEGQDLKRAATISKSGLLAPGQVAFYRYTDQNKIIDEAFSETYHRLALLEKTHSGPAHRLRRMLREGDPYRSGLRSGGVASRLDSIQHLLLVVRQAQSLHHNYQNNGTVDGEAGAVLMGSLERLMDGLCEASATLLGLVPQVTLSQIVHPTNPSKTPDGENQTVSRAGVGYQIVKVALANGGEHSVENVKLGLDSSELPGGIVCDPADPAFFGTLKPGQSVHAAFRLRFPPGVGVVRRLCVADICYHAGGGPAHLRLRPW